ncbi:MAG TPA: hypothetical protein DCE42_30695 [Myxococcales bacterium]|nr:hypothetical protein [Deltaproteobacteria bacterium]MBU47332.1 hypothetical protein [Deltaproteobacteria bacterium]HAA59157.1 hypothetical protein [Myxococcales bacterium]|tara:strand:+ start:8614 stop:9228 length:615 start_codon:yes stop_codon:yes gene_type:complete
MALTKGKPNKKKHVPERSCVACREKHPQSSLVRIVLSPEQEVHIDYLGKCPGRGAYVCPDPKCIQRAAERGGFARAFKTQVKAETHTLLAQAREAASKQIRSLLSLAHRAKVVAAGNSRVEIALREQKVKLLLLATDASDGVKQKFSRWASRSDIPVYETLTQVELAPSVGQNTCSLITIHDAQFAKKIEQEVQRARLLAIPKS